MHGLLVNDPCAASVSLPLAVSRYAGTLPEARAVLTHGSGPHSYFVRTSQPYRSRFSTLRRRGQPGDQGDFVTRLVGGIFGQKVLEDPEPGGLKRLSDEALQELYPAVTDVFADPLEGDSEEVAILRPLLARTQLEKVLLRLAYDANTDGWTAQAFHKAVDTFGAAIVLAKTAGGAVCGGYNPKGWIGLGDNRDSQAAFLFTWPDGDISKRPIKLPKVGGAALAVVDQAGTGPQFGPEGLTILLRPGEEKSARCRLGSYYDKLPDGSRSLFAPGEGQTKRGSAQTQLSDLKVFVAQGGGEEWQLDGIVWKTSRKDAGAQAN